MLGSARTLLLLLYSVITFGRALVTYVEPVIISGLAITICDARGGTDISCMQDKHPNHFNIS